MSTLRRWYRRAAAGIFWLALLTTAPSQESLSDLPPFRDGCRALADSRYGTAATHFQEAWNILESEEAGEIEKEFVTSRLLEAWVKNDDTAAAIEWLDANPSFDPSPARLRWSAVALQKQHRFADAADAYGLLRSLSKEAGERLKLDHAVCLALSGSTAEAFSLLETVSDPTTPGEFLQAALIAGKAGRYDIALRWLERTPEGADPLLRLNLEAWNLIRLGRTGEAFDQILKTLETAPDGASRQRIELLLAAAEVESGVSAPASRAPSSGGSEEATAASAPGLESSDLDFHRRFSRAITDYHEGLFNKSREEFLALAEDGSPANRQLSLYNAALVALQENDFDAFLALRSQLGKQLAHSPRLADLTYLAGLFRAANAEPDALTYLQTFIREHPSHPNQVEARLALAEIHLNQAPARTQAAREIFESLRSQSLTLSQNERLDYTSVWLESIDASPLTFSEKAESFLKEWPGSAYYPEISMLLAKQLFSEKRFEEANRLFHEIATRFPDSPFADLAAFFAAKSSPRGGEAIETWRAMAAAGGPLAVNASHELGLLYLSMDQFEESREALSSVIQSEKDSGSELYFAATADLAFTYYLEALAAENDKALLSRAADTFATLSNSSEAPAHWRFSAAVRRARCLEATGNSAVALEIYRSIIASSADFGPGDALDPDIRSREWIFRAGFFAIRILQENKDWKAAITMADDLSRKNGPRAIEASRLAEQMRLQHWVWD